MKRFLSLLAAVLCGALACVPAAAEERIDNRDLIPAYVPDSEVQFVGTSPDWADDLILAQLRIETATEEGTLEAAVKVLDHYAEMGVSGLLILPVSDRPDSDEVNGYANYGPDTIFTRITGTADYEKGWAKFKTFVDEAHKRHLRVILDVITWGVLQDAPVYRAHPTWFSPAGHTSGSYKLANCRWSENGLVEHWANALVDVAEKTGLDGYRCDCEPSMSGYGLYGIVRDRALYENGQKLLIISEGVSDRVDAAGYPVYDFEQWGGVTYHDRTVDGWGNRLMETVNDTFINHANIVDAVKTAGDSTIYADGRHRLYVNMLSCHDNGRVCAEGDRVYMGYQGIFAPFIPMWFIGEEWNNPAKIGGTGVLYYNEINWDALDKPENRSYFEDVKRMIRVRRQYADVFTYFPYSVREANICKVTTNRDDDLQAYARWYGDTAVLIVPNTDEVRAKRRFDITVPWEEMGITSGGRFVLTDAMTGAVLKTGTRSALTAFSANIGSHAVGVYAITPAAAETATQTTSPATTATATAITTTATTQAAVTTTATTATTAAATTATTAPADTSETAENVPWGVAGAGALLAAVLLAGTLLLRKRRQ